MDKSKQVPTNLLESYSEGKQAEIIDDIIERKPRNYWDKFSNLKKELKVIIKKIGHFPSQKELGRLNLSGVARAVQKHGGFIEVRQNMGYDVIKQSSGHWRDFNNVKKVLEDIIKEIGDFPTCSQLIKLGYSGLSTGIQQYHGGIRNVRKDLGYENETKPNGYWKEWSDVKKEINKLKKKLGHFPTSTEIIELNASLCAGIKKYHGGIQKIREKMGVKELKKHFGYWEDWNNIELELKPVIRKIKHFPTQAELTKLGKSSLAMAIGKYHEGINSVREKLGYEVVRKSHGYWKDFRVIKEQLEEIISDIGEYPSQRHLLENGYSNLVSAICKNHGGWSKVRSRLGYEAPVKPKGYWTHWKNVENALKKFIKKMGDFQISLILKIQNTQQFLEL